MIEIRGVMYEWRPETNTHWSLLTASDVRGSVAYLHIRGKQIDVRVGKHSDTVKLATLLCTNANVEAARRIAEQAVMLGINGTGSPS